jgi:hypothetical protein
MSPLNAVSLTLSFIGLGFSIWAIVNVVRLRRNRLALQESRNQAWQLADSARMEAADAWAIIRLHRDYLNVLMDGQNDYTSASFHLDQLIEATEPGKILQEMLHASWNLGWDAGNDYAIAEPWDTTTAREKNPYAPTQDPEHPERHGDVRDAEPSQREGE